MAGVIPFEAPVSPHTYDPPFPHATLLPVTDPLPLRERLVVSVVVKPSGAVVAGCQDGSVWLMMPGAPESMGWHELDPIPGTPRYQQQQGEVAGF